MISGPIDQDSVKFVTANYKGVTEFKNLVDPLTREVIGIEPCLLL
ncbi:hypothetical protein [Bacillus norwichensis]|nr:hypothetical protein [Bacillus norwichensis]